MNSRDEPACEAFSRLSEIIDEYAPNASRFLEWGSGDNTAALCLIAGRRQKPFVLSLHTDLETQAALASRVPMHPFLHLRAVGYASDAATAASYASYPLAMRLSFDVAVIGAHSLLECALVAAQALNDGGIVIFRGAPSWSNILGDLFEAVSNADDIVVCRRKGQNKRVVARRTETRCIIVVARGERALRELEITMPYTRAYALDVSADCHVVGQDSTLPNHRLKTTALALARRYDRVLLIDADVIIRPNSPDVFALVPDDALGAFPEGQTFPRLEWCIELNDLYGLDDQLRAHEYFNSGVLVFSQKNLHLLAALEGDVVFGHPQFEQGFLNAKRVALKIPLCPLPAEMNYIPDGHTNKNDWRRAFFLHPAGAGKERFLYHELWEDQVGDRKTFTRRPFMSASVRVELLRQASEQMQGRKVLIFDATDFFYVKRYANPIVTETGTVIAFFHEGGSGSARRLAMFGPKVELERGRWRGSFLQQDGAAFEYPGAAFDVVGDHGQKGICPVAEWPVEGRFEFDLQETTSNVEFRIYRSGGAAELYCLHLEAVR